MIKNIVLFGLLTLGYTLQAQDDSRVEGLRRDFISKELQLTSAEADAFFPLYNEYNQKKREARRSLRAEKNSSAASVDKTIDLEQDLIDIKREYTEKFKKILPEKKVVQLLEAEKKFKMMMVQKLKD